MQILVQTKNKALQQIILVVDVFLFILNSMLESGLDHILDMSTKAHILNIK